MGGLFLVGLGIGVFDVGMNLEGAEVERLLGRAIMPHFHAAFSGGTVVSALIGAGLSCAARAGRRAPRSASSCCCLLVTSVVPAAPSCPGRWRRTRPAREVRSEAGIGAAWLEPRTLLIGVVVLAAAFTEGTANDWLAVAFVGRLRPRALGRRPGLRHLPDLHDRRPHRSAPACSTGTAGCRCSGSLFVSAASAACSSSSAARCSPSSARRSGVSARPRLPGGDERRRRRPEARRGPDERRRRRSATPRSSPARRCSASSATTSACCTRCSSSAPWRSSPSWPSPPSASPSAPPPRVAHHSLTSGPDRRESTVPSPIERAIRPNGRIALSIGGVGGDARWGWEPAGLRSTR